MARFGFFVAHGLLEHCLPCLALRQSQARASPTLREHGDQAIAPPRTGLFDRVSEVALQPKPVLPAPYYKLYTDNKPDFTDNERHTA